MAAKALAGALAAGLAALGAAACGGGAASGGPVPALELPEGFAQEVVASGFEAPTAFAFLPDGRILVAQQGGVVRLVEDGATRAQPFLDLSEQVNDFRERGLLGLAVDPEFAENGHVYLLYTHEHDPADYEGPKTARLVRVTARGGTAVPGSEVVILGRNVGDTCTLFPGGSDCIPNEWSGHAVGDLAFASDGTLFLSVGDASSWDEATEQALRAQRLDSLAGKILRVSRTGEGLPSNPFWDGDPRSARSKVWAYGVRNAFRFALRPGSDVPYAGDVGWGRAEEIDVVPAGSNLGWPCYEGRLPQPAYQAMAPCRRLYERGPAAARQPLVTWVQGPGEADGASVVGGDFYSAQAFPAEFHGAYFFGDFVRGFIRYLQTDENDRLISGPTDFALGVEAPVDIQVGPDGALYYLSFTAGELRRIRYTGPAADGGQPLFARPVVHRVGANPHAVEVADANGDGVLDLVAALAGGDELAVLPGTGGGRFGPPARYGAGEKPKHAVAADLDGDGDVDLAVADQGGDGVSVLRGTGDGTFAPASRYPACSRPHELAAGDLDGDGALDLAVACLDGEAVAVLRGRGDGSFERPVEHESGAGPHSLVLRDLDGDGALDVAVANTGDDEVGVLLGTGDGTLQPVVRYPVGDRPHSLRAGDLNGDGRPDLVTANERSGDVSVLLGAGAGRFAASVAYRAGPVPKGVAVGDLDGDGDDDVVTANTAGNYEGGPGHRGGDTVSALLGDGTGALGPPLVHLAGFTPFAVAIADLGGDGTAELVTANWHGGTVSVLRRL